MSSWSDVRVGDIVAGANRYRPAAAAVVVIVLIAVFAPGPRYRRVSSEETAFTPQPVTPVVNTSPTTTAPAPGVTGDAGVAPGTGFDLSSGGSFDSGSTFTGDEAAVAPETSFEPTPPTELGLDPGDGSALAVVASGWASVTAATPLGGEGVPQGTLPVGKRFGQDDKRSFVRLAGQGTVLTLVEDAAGARGPIGTGIAIVRVCKATSSWEEGGGQTFDAVTFDDTTCVDGLDDGSGTWSFDLGSFPADQRVDARGFVLVPGGQDADVDYQVAFKV